MVVLGVVGRTMLCCLPRIVSAWVVALAMGVAAEKKVEGTGDPGVRSGGPQRVNFLNSY